MSTNLVEHFAVPAHRAVVAFAEGHILMTFRNVVDEFPEKMWSMSFLKKNERQTEVRLFIWSRIKENLDLG